MSLCIMEQGCALYRKFLNYDALLCVVSGICFRVLSVFYRMCGCCDWVSICCRVFLGVLGLVYVPCGDSVLSDDSKYLKWALFTLVVMVVAGAGLTVLTTVIVPMYQALY